MKAYTIARVYRDRFGEVQRLFYFDLEPMTYRESEIMITKQPEGREYKVVEIAQMHAARRLAAGLIK